MHNLSLQLCGPKLADPTNPTNPNTFARECMRIDNLSGNIVFVMR